MAPSSTAPSRAAGVSTDDYARRFGALLKRSRREQSLSLRRLAARAGGETSAAELRRYERGERPLDPPTLHELCELYGITVESVLPQRPPVVIDLEQRELRIGTERIALPDSRDPTHHLKRYVEVVSRLRSRPMTSPATLRRGDAEALAEAFELEIDEVVDLVATLTGQAQDARRRVKALRAGAGGLAAVVVVGVAATALPSRSTETVVLSATEVSDDEPEDAEDAEDVGEVRPIPDTATVYGPNLQTPKGSTGAAGGAPAEAEPPVEDETNIDAPGGPVVIEREDVVEDETNIDAPGGPVVIEQGNDEQDQDDED